MSGRIKQTVTAFGILILLLSFSASNLQAKPNRGISLQVFYDELSNYGDWISNPDYGYVWRPDVGRDFRPYYTNGHWAMTEFGNTWVSDYDWGWAPFHYGRWFYDDYDGWIWMPDTEWGPAWVSWRTGGGYYGWAPLSPRININIGSRYNMPDNYWVFIPQRCIYYPSYGRYWEPRRNVYIINNTTIINNIYTNRNVRYYSGPGVDDVRRATRQNVPIYRIADESRPGSTTIDRGNVRIYRPEIKGDGRSAPRTIANNTGRPSRSDDNGANRVGGSGPSEGTARPQRPDANSSSDRDRPARSSSPSGDRGNSPVRQEPSGRNRDNRTIQRPDATVSVERPTSSPRQGSSNGNSGRSERSQQTQPTAPRQESRTESAPRQETRKDSRPQRSEPASSPRQETPRAKPQKESGSPITENNGGRPSNRGN